MRTKLLLIHCLLLLLVSANRLFAQTTQIRGFVDAYTTLQNNKLSFGLGEQDLFITSELNDRFSFLGESVFRFSIPSPTTFDVSIERVVLKYNYSGNHNLLIGKHHTPINYWNDTYHHGRVFFPTIERPMIFPANILPLHTTGFSLQGLNLGRLRFGYDLMIGNGLGSNDITDNDRHKSITAAIHIKPVEGLRIGTSLYRDVISKGATVYGKVIDRKLKQKLLTGSVAYFGKRFELLSESTLVLNKADSIDTRKTIGTYTYGGIRINEKWVPYVRFDYLHYPDGEVLFSKNNSTSFIAGLRYQINYLAVVKLEYQHDQTQLSGSGNKGTLQIAIGF